MQKVLNRNTSNNSDQDYSQLKLEPSDYKKYSISIVDVDSRIEDLKLINSDLHRKYMLKEEIQKRLNTKKEQLLKRKEYIESVEKSLIDSNEVSLFLIVGNDQ
jgi:hypothetical protein